MIELNGRGADRGSSTREEGGVTFSRIKGNTMGEAGGGKVLGGPLSLLKSVWSGIFEVAGTGKKERSGPLGAKGI